MSRRSVRCSACPWTGQRTPALALDTPCPECGSAVELAAATSGRRRSGRAQLQCRPLESTIAWLGEHPARRAAELLDAAAKREGPADVSTRPSVPMTAPTSRGGRRRSTPRRP